MRAWTIHVACVALGLACAEERGPVPVPPAGPPPRPAWAASAMLDAGSRKLGDAIARGTEGQLRALAPALDAFRDLQRWSRKPGNRWIAEPGPALAALVTTGPVAVSSAKSTVDPSEAPWQDPPAPPDPPATSRRRGPFYGAILSLGGGLCDYAGGETSRVTGGGGMWSVRATSNPRAVIGYEVAYVGTSASLAALGDGGQPAALLSTGLEADVRLNVGIRLQRLRIVPFGFAGLGWTRFDVVSAAAATSSQSQSDNVVTVPFGAGVLLAYRRFSLDGRVTYRAAFADDLAALAGRAATNLGQWSVGALVGYELSARPDR